MPPTAVLPPPTSSLNDLVRTFQAVGLSADDMVALTGAHTIGQARCTSFRPHVYNDTKVDPLFAALRQSNCPVQIGFGDNNLAPLEVRTHNHFDNSYYNNLLNQQGLLHSDMQLHSCGFTDSLVEEYGRNLIRYNVDFGAAMIKMGDISPLTGDDGEIRSNCRVVNS